MAVAKASVALVRKSTVHSQNLKDGEGAFAHVCLQCGVVCSWVGSEMRCESSLVICGKQSRGRAFGVSCVLRGQQAYPMIIQHNPTCSSFPTATAGLVFQSPTSQALLEERRRRNEFKPLPHRFLPLLHAATLPLHSTMFCIGQLPRISSSTVAS
jgi:hypothetical protein